MSTAPHLLDCMKLQPEPSGTLDPELTETLGRVPPPAWLRRSVPEPCPTAGARARETQVGVVRERQALTHCYTLQIVPAMVSVVLTAVPTPVLTAPSPHLLPTSLNPSQWSRWRPRLRRSPRRSRHQLRLLKDTTTRCRSSPWSCPSPPAPLQTCQPCTEPRPSKAPEVSPQTAIILVSRPASRGISVIPAYNASSTC